MNIKHLDYAQLSEDAMITADGAASVDECQGSERELAQTEALLTASEVQYPKRR
jgi:hypothetical protein